MTDARASLLLADDEEGIRIVLSVSLEDMGYTVATAASGSEALGKFTESRPDIVITDIKMPGMDGIELLKKIKALRPGTEVLMLTGHGDMSLAVTSLQYGAGDFLSKPVSDAALEVALDRAKQRLSMRETLRRHTEELEKLVAERTRELIRTERFAAVGETAASLAHAIKNIAGALEGTMYVLEKGLELNKREYFEEGWKMIRSDISRLRRLAVSMLDLGRPTRLVFTPVDPERPVRAVMELLSIQAREMGVELELVNDAGPKTAVLAEEAVHQCLLNLVLNAVEAFGAASAFSDGNGQKPHVRIHIQREQSSDGETAIVYTVKDNGPGMEDGYTTEHSGFHTSKDAGSGMGLFATRKIAHEMGAEMHIFSQAAHGTEIVLRLPHMHRYIPG